MSRKAGFTCSVLSTILMFSRSSLTRDHGTLMVHYLLRMNSIRASF
ncbi:hypothetical protein LINGRAHAP2_LOCUS5089 [Linum grandiflorum]